MAEPSLPRIAPRRPALMLGVAAVTGCTAAFHFTGPFWPALVLIPVSALGAFLLRDRPRVMSALVALAVAAVFFAWAGLRAAPSPGSLAALLPDGAEIVRLEGVILEGGDYVQRDPAAFEFPDQPDAGDDFPVGGRQWRSTSFLLQVERLPDLDRHASGIVKLYAPSGTAVEPGTRVSVLGRLRLPRRAGNPGEFDARELYARRGITHILSIPSTERIEVLAEPHPLSPSVLAYRVHQGFHALIGQRVPRDRAAVLGATLLGERGNLSREQRQNYVRSGTVHLLVVSGLHVGLLTGAIVMLLRLLGMDPRRAWAFGALAALLYLGITGVQPSVLRATIMLVVYALGRMLVRRPDALNVLGASAFVSLILRPGDVAELGFQLSYLAVLGIFVFAPLFRLRAPLPASERVKLGFGRRFLDRLGDSARVSLGVGLTTWPLLVYAVHVFSPIMVLANLVAAPLLTLMLVFGLLTPLAVIPGVGAVLAWVLSLLAGTLEAISSTLAAVPYGHLFLPAPPLWWLIGYYALLAGVMMLPRLGWPRVSGLAAWLLWLSVLPLGTLTHTDAPGPARMTSLDVGQGQCIVIEVPNGPCVVVDCGSTSLGGVGERILAPYLWRQGRRHIDMLFVSHADADHVNGLPQVFERFRVGVVYVPETLEMDQTGRDLRAWLERRTEVRTLYRGQWIRLAPGLTIHCLWPDYEWAEALLPERLRRNEGNLVLELRAGPTRVLMPSDAEMPAFAGFLPLVERADILFAPHQGSRVTGQPWLLERLEPGHVVVSARENFPRDDAMAAYRDSGAQVWKSWRHGAVTFLLGADGSVEAQAWLDHEP